MRELYPDCILLGVKQPGQYVGGETNSVVKDHAAVALTVALAYPDAYSVGMSHLGLQILYAMLNARADVAAERVFAPWPDMEDALRRAREPLRSLETHTPLREFGVIGFSLQHELTYTNLLAVLDVGVAHPASRSIATTRQQDNTATFAFTWSSPSPPVRRGR